MRPLYHYTPKKNWVNDPNGLVYHNGTWHMFYQHNPYDVVWGHMSWGHAISRDLLAWEEQPVALYEDDLGEIFSGSAVFDKNNTSGLFPEGDGGLVAIFTHDGKFGQLQSIAYSADGIKWEKYTGNPVLSPKDDPLNDENFRDPKVFWHEEADRWIMIVAGGPVRFFSSPDLLHWSPEGMHPELLTECPDLFKLPVEGTSETRWVLCEGGRRYRIGDFKQVDGRWSFVPENDERYDINFGVDAYAAQTYSNSPDGRVIMVQWMNSWGYANQLAPITGEYNGTFTLCAELTLVRTSEGLRLRQTPIAEYGTLRDNASAKECHAELNPNGENPMADWAENQYELIAEFTPSPEAAEVGLKLHAGEGKAVTVAYDLQTGEVRIDRRGAGARPVIPEDLRDKFHAEYSAPAKLTVDGKVKLRIFVDTTSVEVYANDGMTVGSSISFPDASHDGFEAYVRGGAARIDARMYPMLRP